MLPGGLKPGLGPLRGRVLKDMTWKSSFKTSRAGLLARPSPPFKAPGPPRHRAHEGLALPVPDLRHRAHEGLSCPVG